MKQEIVGDLRQVLKPYLGHWDVPDGGDLVLTIDKVYAEEVKNQRGSEVKPVIYFMEDVKPMVCNATNNNAITALYGKRTKSNSWHGKKIALYEAHESKSQDGLALRVRNYKPISKTCADCGAEIRAHGDFTAEQIVALGEDKYGMALCWECAAKRKGAADGK